MKIKTIALLLVICALMGIFAGCGDLNVTINNPTSSSSTQTPTESTPPEEDPSEPKETQPFIDYAGQVQFDKGSSQTAKVQVTGIKSFIDGDTTHFYVPTSVSATGFVKARYIGVNTPESTGKIEPWGKKASTFTKEKLSSAVSIIVESNDDTLPLCR